MEEIKVYIIRKEHSLIEKHQRHNKNYERQMSQLPTEYVKWQDRMTRLINCIIWYNVPSQFLFWFPLDWFVKALLIDSWYVSLCRIRLLKRNHTNTTMYYRNAEIFQRPYKYKFKPYIHIIRLFGRGLLQW